jgi:hypothetical protein
MARFVPAVNRFAHLCCRAPALSHWGAKRRIHGETEPFASNRTVGDGCVRNCVSFMRPAQALLRAEPSAGLEVWTERALLLLLCAQTAIFVLTVFLTRIEVPFWDMLSFIDSYIDHRDAAGWLGYLWLPDNEHHSLWSRLLTIVEIGAFDGRGPAFQLSSAACLLAGAAALWREFARTAAPAPLVGGAGALACMLLFTVPAAVDCAVPMNCAYIQSTVFLILSLVLFDAPGESGRSAWPRRILGVMAAVAASFGNGVGLLAWPTLLWSAWRGGLRWPWCVGLAAVGLGFVAVYLSHLGTDTALALPSVPEPARLRKMADYALAYAGLPWTRSALLALPGRAIGAALLGAAGVVLVRFGFTLRPLPRLERICLGLILFSLGTMVLASFGRLDQSAEVAVPVRYAVLMTPLQVGLLGLLLRPLGRVWQQRRAMIGAFGLGLGVLLLAAQIPAFLAARTASANITATVQRYLAGERDDTMRRIVFPDLAEADRIFARMRERGVYRWLPVPPASR